MPEPVANILTSAGKRASPYPFRTWFTEASCQAWQLVSKPLPITALNFTRSPALQPHLRWSAEAAQPVSHSFDATSLIRNSKAPLAELQSSSDILISSNFIQFQSISFNFSHFDQFPKSIFFPRFVIHLDLVHTWWTGDGIEGRLWLIVSFCLHNGNKFNAFSIDFFFFVLLFFLSILPARIGRHACRAPTPQEEPAGKRVLSCLVQTSMVMRRSPWAASTLDFTEPSKKVTSSPHPWRRTRARCVCRREPWEVQCSLGVALKYVTFYAFYLKKNEVFLQKGKRCVKQVCFWKRWGWHQLKSVESCWNVASSQHPTKLAATKAPRAPANPWHVEHMTWVFSNLSHLAGRPSGPERTSFKVYFKAFNIKSFKSSFPTVL